MSGTPTTGANSKKALEQMQRLLSFLRHPKYGTGPDAAAAWNKEQMVPYLNRDPAAKASLVNLLKACMIRTRKEDIWLPAPIKLVVTVKPFEYSLRRASLGRAFDAAVDNVVDETKADYIMEVIMQAKRDYAAGKLQPGERVRFSSFFFLLHHSTLVLDLTPTIPRFSLS